MKRTPMLLAMLVAAAVMVQPPRVTAQVAEDEVERFDSKKFFDYSLCAVSIGFAIGTGGWLLAALTCGKALTEHWST